MTKKSKVVRKIRKELKKKFPKTQFKVKSKTINGKYAIILEWTDGASKNYRVKELLFGCIFKYLNTNDVPRIVELNRSYSNEIISKCGNRFLDNMDFTNGIENAIKLYDIKQIDDRKREKAQLKIVKDDPNMLPYLYNPSEKVSRVALSQLSNNK